MTQTGRSHLILMLEGLLASLNSGQFSENLESGQKLSVLHLRAEGGIALVAYLPHSQEPKESPVTVSWVRTLIEKPLTSGAPFPFDSKTPAPSGGDGQ